VGRIDDDCAAPNKCDQSGEEDRRQWRNKYFSWVRMGQQWFSKVTQLARREKTQIAPSCPFPGSQKDSLRRVTVHKETNKAGEA